MCDEHESRIDITFDEGGSEEDVPVMSLMDGREANPELRVYELRPGSLKIAELRLELTTRGLDSRGKKDALVRRLVDDIKAKAAKAAETTDDGSEVFGTVLRASYTHADTFIVAFGEETIELTREEVRRQSIAPPEQYTYDRIG